AIFPNTTHFRSTANQVITGSDADGNSLTFTKAAGPTFKTVTTTNATTGNIALTPGFADAGTYSSTVTATDNGSPPLSDSKSFTITVNNVNRAPSLNAVNNMTVNEGATANQVITGSDPDGDTLTLTTSAVQTYMTVTTSTPSLHDALPISGFADAGTYSSTVTATDNGSPPLSDSKSFTITVNNVNRAPTLNAIANMNVAQGATADQVITGSDADGNALTFTKAAGPTFVTVTTTNATSGNVHAAPGFGDAAGPYPVTVTATDNGSPPLSDSKSFIVQVGGTNRAPTLNAISNMTVNEGATTNQVITGSDADGNALTFTKAAGPTYMTVTTTNATTGNIALTPGFSDAGTAAATVTATDNSPPALSNSRSFT